MENAWCHASILFRIVSTLKTLFISPTHHSLLPTTLKTTDLFYCSFAFSWTSYSWNYMVFSIFTFVSRQNTYLIFMQVIMSLKVMIRTRGSTSQMAHSLATGRRLQFFPCGPPHRTPGVTSWHGWSRIPLQSWDALLLLLKTFIVLEYNQRREGQVQRWKSEWLDNESSIPDLTKKSLCLSKLTWNYLNRVISQKTIGTQSLKSKQF